MGQLVIAFTIAHPTLSVEWEKQDFMQRPREGESIFLETSQGMEKRQTFLMEELTSALFSRYPLQPTI